MKVPAYTLVPMPDDMSFSTGAAVSCGTGTAFGALQRLNLSGRDTIAIFGQGPVGLSGTQLSVAMGARVIAVDIVEERRKLALEFGADAAIDPSDGTAVQQIQELTQGRGVDCALIAPHHPRLALNPFAPANLGDALVLWAWVATSPLRSTTRSS